MNLQEFRELDNFEQNEFIGELENKDVDWKWNFVRAVLSDDHMKDDGLRYMLDYLSFWDIPAIESESIAKVILSLEKSTDNVDIKIRCLDALDNEDICTPSIVSYAEEMALNQQLDDQLRMHAIAIVNNNFNKDKLKVFFTKLTEDPSMKERAENWLTEL